MTPTAWHWRRLGDPAIRPLEIWAWRLGHTVAQAMVGLPALARIRAAGGTDDDVAEQLARGVEGLVRRLEATPERVGLEAGDLESVVLAGGLAATSGLETRLLARLAELGVVTLRDPQRAGLRGGRIAASHAGFGDAVVVDVGQSSIKVAPGQAQDDWEVARPLAALPVTPDCPKDRRWAEEQARRAASWIGETLGQALMAARSSGPTCAILGLPAELDKNCVPGPCTYAGWELRPGFVAEVASAAVEAMETAAGSQPTPSRVELYVANDAELAAWCAREEVVGRRGRMFVITLGYGPGGAVVEGPAEAAR